MPEAIKDLIAGLPAGTSEILGTWVAALLTLAVLSYIVGDNPAFRLSEHLFVGVSAGYAASLAWNHVLWPRLWLLLGAPATYWHYGIFFVLGLMLLTRGISSISVLGNLPLGVMFGTGAGLALGGALIGSLIPQLRASVASMSPGDYGTGALGWAYALDALLLMLGTIAVLSAFHFAAHGTGLVGTVAHRAIHSLGRVGRLFIMVAFGALLAGAALSFFAILSSRLDFLLHDWGSLFGNMGL